MVKAIITDLDDTLLRRDKTISAFTAQTLRQCREKGVKLMLATARGESAKDLAPFEWFDGQVLMNGALAIADGRAIFQRLMAPQAFVPFLTALDRAGIQAAAEMGGAHYANFHVPNRAYALTAFGSLKEAVAKLYAIVDTPHKKEVVRKTLPRGLYAHFTKDDYAVVTHGEARKINAIAALLKHWGLSLAEALAFGDDGNDIDMLAQCGVGVAMGNALDAVKAAADESCGDCDEDGVANWLCGQMDGWPEGPGALIKIGGYNAKTGQKAGV